MRKITKGIIKQIHSSLLFGQPQKRQQHLEDDNNNDDDDVDDNDVDDNDDDDDDDDNDNDDDNRDEDDDNDDYYENEDDSDGQMSSFSYEMGKSLHILLKNIHKLPVPPPIDRQTDMPYLL